MSHRPGKHGNRPGKHADGYAWHTGLISNRPSHTLVDPDGQHVAHAYRCSDSTWAVVDGGTGEVVIQDLPDVSTALKVGDNTYRPCAHVDTHPSHGIVACDGDRTAGSVYCAQHNGLS